MMDGMQGPGAWSPGSREDLLRLGAIAATHLAAADFPGEVVICNLDLPTHAGAGGG